MRPLQPISAPGVSGPVARVADLRAAGVPHHRLYASDQARPLHGIVSATGVDPRNFETRIAATRLLLREGSFISRRSAARLLGIPVDGGEHEIDVGVILPVKLIRRAGISSHQLRAGALLELPNQPAWLPAPSEVWALLGAVSNIDQLVIAGDFLVSGATRAQTPMCSIDDLRLVSARFAGCAGIAKLREALPLLRTGVESPAESRARLLIVRAGFPEPQTCCPVPVSGRLFHADLGYEDWKIAVEYEGEYHFTGGLEQARRDAARHEAMLDAGWRVLRLTAIDLRAPEAFLARLRRAIHERTR